MTNGLEFRVGFRAVADLWLDRIIVVAYPIDYGTSAQWTLIPGNGPKTVQAKFIDGAGNISLDAVANIVLGPTATVTKTASPTPSKTPLPILTPQLGN